MNTKLAQVASFFAVTSVAAALLAGCAGDADPDTETEEVQSTEANLRQGGCSMSEIRGWQAVCRDVCGGSSAGIHYCYAGMSMRHANDDGACACN